MRTSQAHIAGIGLSAPQVNKDSLQTLAVSAATKALLDAGATYSDVDESFACFLDDSRIPRTCFDTFGRQGAPICEVDNYSGLMTAAYSVWSRRSNCSLVVGLDEDGKGQNLVVAVVLVSDLFLTSHAYLKDGAVCILGSSAVNRIHSRTSGGDDTSRQVKAAVQSALSQAKIGLKECQIIEQVGSASRDSQKALSGMEGKVQKLSKSAASFAGMTGFASLCGLVWQLRGWANDAAVQAQNCLQFTVHGNGAISILVLSRSDGRPALKWSEVENVRDGRERLGYNPAVQARNITREDIEAVRASEHFVPLDVDIKQLGFGIKGGDRAALARL